MELGGNISQLNGVGEKTGKILLKVGVKTVRDLLYYLPRGYKDFSVVKSLREAQEGETALFAVRIFTAPKTRRIRKGLEITSFEVSDETAVVTVDIFNQVYIKTYLRVGERLYLYGKQTRQLKRLHIASPELYFKKPEDSFLPVYPLTAGLTHNMLRKYVKEALLGCAVQELYSDNFLKKFSLMGMGEAMANIHFPQNLDCAMRARERIVLDELLVFCRMIELLNQEKALESRLRVDTSEVEKQRFLQKLPFAPTHAQQRVMNEIADDLKGERYMNRLVQGDVGSGKTAIAFFAIHCMRQAGYQSVMMAPTELLAEQHYRAACELFPEQEVVLVTGSLSAGKRKSAMEKIKTGEAAVVIGTHALIYADAAFARLGLLITDEQHRFGVKQRAALSGAGDVHTLIMSATPIPRSLALVIYGKTDVSIVDELPPGRKPVKTYMIRKHKYQEMICFIRRELENGGQAYIVCPLIEESEAMEVKSARQMFEEITQCYPGITAGLLHGKLKPAQKQEIMHQFSAGEVKILVSTTVIEVGVNVPNATVMVVMGAERFGLAQLHQLRGRVGRGGEQSYCFLVSDHQNAFARLAVMTQTGDGFVIAEKDMEFRGAGDVFGTRQHGEGALQAANLIRDMKQLEKARKILKLLEHTPEFQFEYKGITYAAEEKMRDKMMEIAFN